MVIIRSVAEIVADFPDDEVTEGNNIVLYGGRGILEAVEALLLPLRYKVTTRHYEDFKGWSVRLKRGGSRYRFRVTHLGDRNFGLGTWCESGLLLGNVRQHVQFLEDLDMVLRRDGRFSGITWYALERGERADPSPSPVEWHE